jgi:Uma2 family endonuclease
VAANPHPRIPPEEYLELDRASEHKHEYYNGEMFAMSGGSPRHAVIAANLIREFGIAVETKGCLVATSDLRVRAAPSGLYTYPDLTVYCGDLRFAEGTNDTIVNPALLVEVLLPSSESHDRGLKWEQYRQIESLRDYVLVSQDRPRVEGYARQTQGWLFTEFIGSDARCRFPGLGCEIDARQIYRGIQFD